MRPCLYLFSSPFPVFSSLPFWFFLSSPLISRGTLGIPPGPIHSPHKFVVWHGFLRPLGSNPWVFFITGGGGVHEVPNPPGELLVVDKESLFFQGVWCSPWEATDDPIDVPIPIHILAALSEVNEFLKRVHRSWEGKEVGRIGHELDKSRRWTWQKHIICLYEILNKINQNWKEKNTNSKFFYFKES